MTFSEAETVLVLESPAMNSTQYIQACQRGNLKSVKKYVAESVHRRRYQRVVEPLGGNIFDDQYYDHFSPWRNEPEAIREDDNVSHGVNWQDDDGASGLMWSIARHHMAVVNFLLSLPDIDVNLSNETGSALHWAVEFTNEEALKVLVIRKDVDMRIKNRQGKTAKELAEMKKKDACVAIIEEASQNKREAKALDEAHHELVTGVAAMAGTSQILPSSATASPSGVTK